MKLICSRRCLLVSLSPPSRRRGLKFMRNRLQLLNLVASFAEAWIEIKYAARFTQSVLVASFAEAWIEILMITC